MPHRNAKPATAARHASFQLKIADPSTLDAQPLRGLMKINQSHLWLTRLWEWANQFR